MVYKGLRGEPVTAHRDNETEWFTFIKDTPLSVLGEIQAESLESRLPDLKNIDHVLFSTERRTWDTGEKALKWTDLTYDEGTRLSGSMKFPGSGKTVTWSKSSVSLDDIL